MLRQAVALRAVPDGASASEVAAIVAALTAIADAQARAAADASTASGDDGPSRWVLAARLAARRRGYERGDWRVSGRMGRRRRA